MDNIKIFLSDHQILFREGLHFTFSAEENIEVIGEAESNEEALTAIKANPPDIAILSLQDKTLPGPEITHRIKRNLPSVAVILTAETLDDESVFSAMKAGASACILKDSRPEFLIFTAKEVAEGRLPIARTLLKPSMASKVIAEFDNFATLDQQLHNVLAILVPEETHLLSSIAESTDIDKALAKLNITEEAAERKLRGVVNKLVTNDYALTLIEAAQQSLPSLIRVNVKPRSAAEVEYVTKQELKEFKKNLLALFTPRPDIPQ